MFLSGRLKNQRKAVVTTVDKKIPNGILEEQGNVVSHCEKQRVDCESDRLAVQRSTGVGAVHSVTFNF